MILLWMFLLLVLVVGALALVLSNSNDGLRVAEIVSEPGYTAGVDREGRVVHVDPSRLGCDTVLDRYVRASLFPMHMFALGALSGVCISLFIARVILHRPEPTNYMLWLAAWLCAALLVSAVVFAAERYVILNGRRRGVFDQLFAAGHDPVEVGAAIYRSIQMCGLWGCIIMFAGGALLSATDTRGLLGFVVMGSMSGILGWKARDLATRPIRLRNLDKQLQTVRGFLIDGGWVTPLGTLICTASLGLIYFGRAETTLLMCLTIAGCLLVAWSERVSRIESHQHTLDEWREILRNRLVQTPASQAGIQSTL